MRGLGVFVREDCLPGYAPIYANIWVVKTDSLIAFGSVVIGALINDLCIRRARDKAVQEPFGYQQLQSVLGG